MMAIADLFIGDISSMSLEFTAIDKPIILVKKLIEDQDPSDFRLFAESTNPIVDLGDIVTTKSLEETIAYRLKNDSYKKIRNYWKDLLLGTIDGGNALREAEVIENFIQNYYG
jgi:CDP-glycerol glycerophosphotransferase (TagB/SpsB family)